MWWRTVTVTHGTSFTREGGDVRAFTPWEIEGRKREGILVHYLEKPRGYHGEWSLLHLGQQLL